MIIGEKKNETQLIGLIPSIKNFMWEWQIITVKLPSNSTAPIDEMVQNLYHIYKQYEGIIYPPKSGKIVMLIRLGTINNYAIIKSEIEGHLPQYRCRVMVRKMNTAGLRQIQIDLNEPSKSAIKMAMFEERERRNHNKIMIVDDDMFIRKVMKSMLGVFGSVIEVERASNVLTSYLTHNPDVVILDIHMPETKNLALIDEIMGVDTDAFIIVFSADSVKENVLTSIEKGAVGFLSKPPNKEKLAEYMRQCITLK